MWRQFQLGRLRTAHSLTRRTHSQPHKTHSQPQQAHSHKTLSDEIASLDRQASEILARIRTPASERQTVDILRRCAALCGGAGLAAADTRRLCAIADALAQQPDVEGRMQADMFAAYLELYAQLGRPDVTQLAMRRVGAGWSRPPQRVYAAQILALLRFQGDAARGALLARTTDGDASRVRARLASGSVRALVDAQVRRERVLRGLARALVLGPCAAFAWLGVSWVHVGTHWLGGAELFGRVVAAGAALALGALSIRLVLRHSVMGQLSAHDNSAAAWARATRTAAARLPPADEARALRILWRAFPAAPFDRAVDALNAILTRGRVPGELPRMSWRLRAGLRWALVARRLALVEAPLLGDHGVRQRLAVLWLRCLPRMADQPCAAAAPAVTEFARFVRDRFARVPLALAPAEARELSRFVARRADARALDAWLDLAAAGFVAVDAARVRDDTGDEFLAFRRPADEAMLFADAAELAACRATARAVVFAAVLDSLDCREHASDSLDCHEPAADARARTLDRLLAMPVGAVPLTPALCRAAFAAACALPEPARVHRLVRLIEDSAEPAPVAVSLAPLFVWLARTGAGEDRVLPLVARWHARGILAAAASVQCLDAALAAAPAEHAAERAAAWTEHACALALSEPAATVAPIKDAQPPSESPAESTVAPPLGALAARALAICHTRRAPAQALRVHAAWAAAARASPPVRARAPPALTSAALRLLAHQSRHAAPAQAAGYLRHALAVLDLMRARGHVPPPDAFAQLCRAAAALHTDIASYVDYWTPVLRNRAKTTKLDSFARSLF
ncbi:hypothetical protein H4S02_005325 [Coemansia sp. RSA 2611]|nr:hypothetical protein H4S01_004255 [Coemansia sp. RSA 2610]KAJ2383388.1 hypothetical protein H4S02_005325 [Coemansia sp. RSA 2611]